MAMTDWIKSVNGTANAVIDLVNSPILGNASLLFTAGLTTTNCVNLVPTDSNVNFPKGYTKGRQRALFRVLTGGTGAQGLFGFAFMQSANSLVTGTPNCYIVEMKQKVSTDPGAIETISVLKLSGANLQSGSGTILATVDITDIATNTIFAVQVDWIYDAVELSGTNIKVYLDPVGSDFADLAQIVSYTDTSSPFTTSVAEGIFARVSGGSHPFRDTQVDSQSLYQLV